MTRTQTPLRLPADTYATIRTEAAARGCSINALVNELIEEHLRTNRAELIALIGQNASERYKAVLDKLADL